MSKINLGDEVMDIVTGYRGIAICRMTWLHGCDRIIVQAKGMTKEGKTLENATFDEPQLKVIKKNKVAEGNRDTGGPGYAFKIGKEFSSRR